MKKLIDFLSRHPYLWMFLGALLILIIKFPYFWTGSDPLAGYDTVGHYEAFLKQISLFREARIKGYDLSWFGGMPVFYFYSPLFFWLGALIAVIVPVLAPAVIFKLLILACLAALPPAFYYFAKTFLPQEPNPWIAFTLSLLYIFFQPHEFGELGIGLSGAVAAGLSNQAPGLILSLLFLSYYKCLIDGKDKFWHSPYFYLTVLAGTLLFYTHILSTIFAAVLALFIFLSKVKNKQTSVKSLIAFLSVALLCAYYLLPFLAYYGYSSDWSYRRGEGFFSDPLQVLFNFDLLELLNGRFAVFNWQWLAVVIAAAGGVIALFKRQSYLVVTMFLVPFLIIPRDYLSQVLGVSLHYYRMIPLLLIVFLTISLFGFDSLWNWMRDKRDWRVWNIALWFFLSLLALWRIQVYSFHLDGHNLKPNLIVSTYNPYEYFPNLTSYPGAQSGQALIDCLAAQPDRAGRVSLEHDLRYLMQQLGSTHYFDYFLPEAGWPIVQGLYSESAYQTAFIYPAFSLVSPQMQTYNYPVSQYLLWNGYYMSQPMSEAIRQLGMFNTEYIVSFSSNSSSNLSMLGADVVQPVSCPGSSFSLFRVNDSLRRPYVSVSSFPPLLFVEGSNSDLSFRKLSLGWYTMSRDLSSYPIIYDRNLNVSRLPGLPEKEKSGIAGIVVASEALSDKEVSILRSLNKPVIILSRGQYSGPALPVDFTFVSDFRPVFDFDSFNLPQGANISGMEVLRDFIIAVAGVDKRTEWGGEVERLSWEDEKIAFSSFGPTIINAAYFPAWKSVGETEERVYEVTPGQMLVFSEGNTELSFQSTLPDKAGMAISILSAVSLLAIFIYRKKIT